MMQLNHADMYAPFVVSGIVWHEIGEKVAFDNTNLMKSVLNEKLKLSDYGSGVAAIACIFIALPPNDSLHEEITQYSRQMKEVNLQVKLDFASVAQQEKPKVLRLMASAYLQAIHSMKILKIPDFALAQFAKDVAKLFEAQGWLEVGTHSA